MRYRKNLAWIILAGIAFAVLFVLVTMYLWNWLIPDLFDGPVINFWQTAGLLLLAKILFGFGGKGGWKKHKSHRYKNLSPEEKAILKRRFMEKCGWKKEENPDVQEENLS